MNYIKITDTEHLLFTKAWNLYKISFPTEERRQLRTQKKIMNHPLYNFELITDKNQFIGFITWWKFDNLRYIEHFAISPNLRGNGYGLQILTDFIAKLELPVLLEVEHPKDDTSKRRIRFYQRAGFILNEYPYKHPPYKKGGNYVPLMLMTYPNTIKNEELNIFLEKCHPIIHKFVLN